MLIIDFYLYSMNIRKFFATKFGFFWTIVLLSVSSYYMLSEMPLMYHVIGAIAKFFHIPTAFDVRQDMTTDVLPYDVKSIEYVINNPILCVSNTFLVVLVKSNSKHFERRKAIRESWGNISKWGMSPSPYVLVLFSVAVAKSNHNQLQIRLNEENNACSDLIQEKFLEDFHNLTRKVVGQINWMKKFCPNAKYFMSTDDDVFVNIRNLVHYLHHSESDDLYLGCVHSGSSPERDSTSKYFVSRSIYSGLYYPDYCPGAGYVLSSHVIQLMYDQMFGLPLFYIDDVFVGILAAKVGVKAYNSAQFFCEHKVPYDPCYYDYFITSHSYTPENLVTFMNLILTSKNSGLFCSFKLATRKLFH